MDAAQPARSYDLSRQFAARLKWDRPMRILLPICGILAVGAGPGNYFEFQREYGSTSLAIVLSVFFVVVGSLAILAPWTFYGPRVRLVETTGEGVMLHSGSSRRVTYRWGDRKLRIELWDMRAPPPDAAAVPGGRLVLTQPSLPPDLELLWYSPGRAFNLSREAFDGILDAANSVGAQVTHRRVNAEGHRGVDQVVIAPSQ